MLTGFERAERFFSRGMDARALARLFDFLPEVFLFVKDREHRFVMANRALYRMHGCRSEQEMLGRTDHDFHPPVLAQQYVDEDRRVMESGKVLIDQVWLVPDAGGHPRWYLSTKMPVRDRSGAVCGVAGFLRPHEHAGEAPQEYRRLVPAIDAALKRYGEPLAMRELAELAHLSLSQFQREFRRLFRMTPSAFLQQVRLQAARRRIEDSDVPIGTIAVECGFFDQSHFGKAFLRAMGVRPIEHRRSARERRR